MPTSFESWTVLPHQPIEKHSDSFWTVRGTLPTGKTTRVMSVARMTDGRLVIHNGIALEDGMMAEIEALGTPAVLVVPGGYHRLDAKAYKSRYPGLKVYCPAGATGRVSQVVSVDGDYNTAPKDEAVSLTHLEGTRNREGVLQVKGAHGTALVFNDAINNLPAMGGVFGFLFAPTGRPAVPRLARWMMVSDKGALRGQFDTLAGAGDLSRVVVSHGAPITENPSAALRAVGAELTG